MEAKMPRAGQGGKRIDQRVSYALNHPVRVECLRLLNEGVFTADDLAPLVGESRNTVHHHLKALLEDDRIEIVKIERKRNTAHYYYRAIGKASFDRDALEAMTPEERQELVGLVVQHSTAELLAALAAGKLSDDPRVSLVWNWVRLDAEGREDVFEEHERSWEHLQEIAAESANRSAGSGEALRSYILAQWGFERANTGPVPAANAD